MEKIRILVLSNVEWSDENAFGNTMSNLFENSEDLEILSLYRRNASPKNNVCKKYYQISYSSIVKNIFSPRKIGNYFEINSEQGGKEDKIENKEKALVRFIHKWKLTRIVSKIEGFLFKRKTWENQRYKKLILEFRPDIVISFTSALDASRILVESVLKLVSSCKFVTFLTDDVYGNNKSKKVKENIKKQMLLAHKIYAITPSLKERYENLYGVNIDILRKGCSFTNSVLEKNNEVINIVYAGNLLYGRERTLIRLVEEIAKVNKKTFPKVFLSIYSSTLIGNSLKKKLSVDGVSEFYGAKSYEEIKTILQNADLVLHVESFEKKQQNVVRYSFSTKITDCLQCGSALFAIGPKDLASIEMIREMPGAVIINSMEELEGCLLKLKSMSFFEEAMKIREYAKENYDIKKIQKQLIQDLKVLCEK